MDSLFYRLQLLVLSLGILIIAGFGVFSVLLISVGPDSPEIQRSTVYSSFSNDFHSVSEAMREGVASLAGRIFDSVIFVLQLPGKIVSDTQNVAIISALTRPADATTQPVIKPQAYTKTIASANVALAAAATTTESPSQPDTTAAWPIHGAITTGFGVSDWPYERVHTGLDISDGKPAGTTPIHPFKPGRVVEVIHSAVGLGNHVTVDHGSGITSVYGHLAYTTVQAGQSIDKTTVLGYEGSTGASTGTHLHFEIRLNNQPVNPLSYINGQP